LDLTESLLVRHATCSLASNLEKVVVVFNPTQLHLDGKKVTAYKLWAIWGEGIVWLTEVP